MPWGLVAACVWVLIPASAWVLGWRLSRRARSADRNELPGIWFAHLRLAEWMLPVSMLLWVAVAVNAIGTVPFPDGPEWLLLGAAAAGFFAPPVLADLLYAVAARGVVQRARGAAWTAAEVSAQWFWKFTGFLLPVIGVVVATLTFRDGYHRLAAASAALSVLVFFAASARRWKSHGIVFLPLESGELRDRVFELAGGSGTRVRGVALMGSTRGPLMGAFAALGARVLVAEDLVRALPRDEVDAIVAHELAHIKKGHFWWMVTSSAAAVAAANWLLGYVPVDWVAEHSLLIAAPVGGLAAAAMSRRNERAADRGSAELGAGPEASIRALAHLTELNLLPARWSGWDVKAMSHPSLEERARAIAAHFGVAEERVKQLMAEPVRSEDRYPVPDATRPALFAVYRERVATRNLWTYVACLAVPPAAASWAVPALPFGLAWVLGGAAAYLTARWLLWMLRVRDFRGMEREFRDRTGLRDGVFVGLSPTEGEALYEGLPFWDIGVVEFAGRTLSFTGEQISFSAPIGAEARWVRAAPGWVGPPAARLNGFRLAPLTSDGLRGAMPSGESGAEPAAPRFPEVTRTDPRSALLSGGMFALLLIVVVVAAGATAVLGREWSPMPAAISGIVLTGSALWDHVARNRES